MRASPLIISLSFLIWLCFTTTKPLSLLASASKEAEVNDVNGEALVEGNEYYIMSAIWGAGGGGVKPERTGDASSCSYSILQESSDMKRGAPVKFHVEGTSTDRKIYARSTDLEIEFVKKPECAESSKWVVAYESGSSSSSSRLVIGGPEDHPDSVLVTGAFKIEVLNAIAYKLVFCRRANILLGSSSLGTCYDVGVDYKEEGIRNLVVRKQNSGNVFMVAFVKAESDKGKSSII